MLQVSHGLTEFLISNAHNDQQKKIQTNVSGRILFFFLEKSQQRERNRILIAYVPSL